MDRMVGEAKFQVDHRGDPSAGPDLPPEAIGFGATVQQVGQAGELCGREPARGPGRRAVAQGVGTLLAGTLHPLADGPLAHAQGLGDLAL